jgi:hypothetical protein
MPKNRAHGEGSIHRLADGTWRAYVYDERKRRRCVRGETRILRTRTAGSPPAGGVHAGPAPSG